jgi:hypothetical protein
MGKAGGEPPIGLPLFAAIDRIAMMGRRRPTAGDFSALTPVAWPEDAWQTALGRLEFDEASLTYVCEPAS